MEHPLVKALKEAKYTPREDLCGRVWQDVSARAEHKAGMRVLRYSVVAIVSIAALTQTPKLPTPFNLIISLLLVLLLLLSLKLANRHIHKSVDK
jgi:hypothetical protein